MKRQKQEETKYGFTELCGNGLRSFFAMEFLLHGLFMLLGSEFPEWKMGMGCFLRMQLFLIPVLIYFELLAGAKKRFQEIGKIAALLVIPAGSVLYILLNQKHLLEGFQQAYNDYMKYWNDYYKSNYGFFGTEGEWKALFLTVLVLVVFVLCMLTRYVTGIRLFFMVPGILVITLGLLVNCLPSWRGLAEYFLGVIFLFSAPWRKEKIAFRQSYGRGGKKGIGGQLISIAMVFLLGGVIVICTTGLLGEEAEKIQKHSQQFIEFQQQLEEKLSGLSLQLFSKNEAVLDNHTPKYTGKEILKIHASDLPSSDLYLKDFCSGVYQNGRWQESEDFEKEALRAGYTPEHIGSLLHQQFFEQKITQEEYLDSQENPILEYSIDYTGGKTGLALVPYFSDLSGCKDSVMIEDDSVVYKKKNKKILKFRGLDHNAFYTGGLYDFWDMNESNEALDWYGKFVSQRDVSGSKDIPALSQYVSEIYYIYGTYGMTEDSIPYMDEESNYEINFNRLVLAGEVRNLLSEKASYNLYLDDIPAGTDTIQYFLETGHEGYCMHFASAAVLILQEMGVPARYASGYIVNAPSFQEDNGQYTAKVVDRNAHAWAEIYLENYGWIPYEMTPGYMERTNSLPTDEGNQENLKKQHQEKAVEKETETTQVQEPAETQASESQEKETQERETQGTVPAKPGTQLENESKSGKRVLLFLLPLLLLLMIAAVPVWQLKREREKLNSEIRRRKYRRAVCRMNRRIYKRLWNHAPEVLHLPMKKQGSSKVHFSYLTDEEFLQRLIQTYPAVSPEDWKHYMEIVQKAAFSREEITKEEMRFCYDIFRKH